MEIWILCFGKFWKFFQPKLYEPWTYQLGLTLSYLHANWSWLLLPQFFKIWVKKWGGHAPPPGSYGLETVRMWKAQSFKHSETFGNLLKVQATFLYSIYHQRAGKTNLFHMRGGRFHAGNTLGTFKGAPCLKSPELEPFHINQPNIKYASEITEGEPIEFNVRMPRLAVRMARNKVQCSKLCSCYVTSHI